MNDSFPIKLTPILRGTAHKRGAIFGAILVAALLAFELFNYSTTAFALSDVLGDLSSMNLRWSTILAIAFCGIDFAGIARLFTPQLGRDESAEAWYLFGAWLLAAGFNATLTWWGVSVAIRNHTAQGSILIGQELLLKVVPVFVAVMVWMIRVLVIGTFSIAGENLFSVAQDRPAPRPAARPLASTMHLPLASSYYPRPAPKPVPATRPLPHPEPTYHPVGISARSYEENSSIRR
jgi:hypothetical protein